MVNSGPCWMTPGMMSNPARIASYFQTVANLTVDINISDHGCYEYLPQVLWRLRTNTERRTNIVYGTGSRRTPKPLGSILSGRAFLATAAVPRAVQHKAKRKTVLFVSVTITINQTSHQVQHNSTWGGIGGLRKTRRKAG